MAPRKKGNIDAGGRENDDGTKVGAWRGGANVQANPGSLEKFHPGQ
jgi:hypothetical protein